MHVIQAHVHDYTQVSVLLSVEMLDSSKVLTGRGLPGAVFRSTLAKDGFLAARNVEMFASHTIACMCSS